MSVKVVSGVLFFLFLSLFVCSIIFYSEYEYCKVGEEITNNVDEVITCQVTETTFVKPSEYTSGWIAGVIFGFALMIIFGVIWLVELIDY